MSFHHIQKLHSRQEKKSWRQIHGYMAKGFIDNPHGEEGVQWPTDNGDGINPAQSGPHAGTRPQPPGAAVTPEEEGNFSSASSQEHLPPPIPSPLSPPVPSPSSPPSSHPSLPSLLSLSPSSPSSSYHQNANISLEELNVLALQDTENNNVDENCNDQQYEHYASYHQEFSQHQFVPDPSVRRRVRTQQTTGDEPDRAPVEDTTIRRRSRNDSFSHRRNLSEDLTLSCSSKASDGNYSFSPLPNLSPGNPDSDRLPRLPAHPDCREDSHHHSPLPPPYSCSQNSAPSRTPNRWFPLNLKGGGQGTQSPPSYEEVTQETEELLMDFTSNTLRNHNLYAPETERVLRHGFSNPAWTQTGQELRRLADKFAETEERRKVQGMAQSVSLESISMDNFLRLCAQLFQDGITLERIIALFTFIGDVAVRQVRFQGNIGLRPLMNWALTYLIQNICSWVQKAGGWAVVLSQGANMVFKAIVCTFCLVGTVASVIFIMKSLKDW